MLKSVINRLGVMLYLVLNEHQVTAFNFYLNDKIQQGMRYGFALYGLAYTFDPEMRLAAYNFAQQLIETDCSVVVTVGKNYKVWVGLKASEYPYYELIKDPVHPATALVG